MNNAEYNLNTVDFNYFLAELRKGEIMNETSFYFVDEISEPEHYIGCLPQYEKPYWAVLCGNLTINIF